MEVKYIASRYGHHICFKVRYPIHLAVAIFYSIYIFVFELASFLLGWVMLNYFDLLRPLFIYS